MRRSDMILCACCGEVRPGDNAREYQGAWCTPNVRGSDGRLKGSHTDPQEIDRTGVFICGICWPRRDGKWLQRRLWGHLDQIRRTLRNAVREWIPKAAGQASLDGEAARAQLKERMRSATLGLDLPPETTQ